MKVREIDLTHGVNLFWEEAQIEQLIREKIVGQSPAMKWTSTWREDGDYHFVMYLESLPY